jgi:hypothetical protein
MLMLDLAKKTCPEPVNSTVCLAQTRRTNV